MYSQVHATDSQLDLIREIRYSAGLEPEAAKRAADAVIEYLIREKKDIYFDDEVVEAHTMGECEERCREHGDYWHHEDSGDCAYELENSGWHRPGEACKQYLEGDRR